jgi:pimeloyl-ACP methyl ester carboxylesterase
VSATGGLVDVGGHRLRVDCRGTGLPTVLMDAGLSQPMRTWGTIPAGVAGFTRVCTYDRAGVGESDRGPRPRTSRDIVDELDRLVANAPIPGPYVVVGHSFGGLNMRLFAIRHPGEVVGIVLVDASHEAQYARFVALMPPGEREAYLQHEQGDNGEGVDLVASGALVAAAGALPPVPLVVLSARDATEPPGGARQHAHDELQAELARLTSDGRRIFVEDAGNFIQLDRPAVVLEAIRTVVEDARRRLVAPAPR